MCNKTPMQLIAVNLVNNFSRVTRGIDLFNAVLFNKLQYWEKKSLHSLFDHIRYDMQFAIFLDSVTIILFLCVYVFVWVLSKSSKYKILRKLLIGFHVVGASPDATAQLSSFIVFDPN